MRSTANLRVERQGAIEMVTLDRASALNALSREQVGVLLDYCRGLKERLDVRVTILRADGRAFCTGLDIKGWKWPKARLLCCTPGARSE